MASGYSSRESPQAWFTRRNEAISNPQITPDDLEMTALCEQLRCGA
jgi:hypothetical protein